MKPPYFIAKDLQLIFRIVYLITEIVEKDFLLKFKIDEAKTEYLRFGRILIGQALSMVSPYEMQCCTPVKVQRVPPGLWCPL